MTIQQTIEIPADHRLHLDMLLPESLPDGQAKIKLSIKPFAKKRKKPLPEDERDLSEGVPIGGGMRYFPAHPGYTPHAPGPELAALIKEGEERAERERTDPVYRAHVIADLRKCQENGPIFGGMDGDEFQRRARDEWPD